MKQETLKKYFKEFDVVRISLTDGKSFAGMIEEFEDDSIVIKNKTTLALVLIDSIRNIEKSNDSNAVPHEDKIINTIPTKTEGNTIQNNSTSLTPVQSEVKSEILVELEPITHESFDSFEPEDIPWKEDGLPDEELFKGRNELIERLVKHYKSIERKKTYMLYGLTRTGKSSILKYFDKEIINQPFKIDKPYKFISFIWDLSKAANQSNAKDMWYHLLGHSTCDRIKKMTYDDKINLPDSDIFHLTEYRAKHLRDIIEFLKINNYFPIFLIDEFTYYENLAKSKKVDSSFLQTLRQLAFDNFACFVYAGTYNLKKLLKNPEYGLTGQFVNTIEESISQIDVKSATELITVFDKIKFDDKAIEQILLLTNRVPYFIQIICKNIGFYCHENNHNHVTKSIVETVTKILVGDVPTPKQTMVRRISSGTFDNNQFNPIEINSLAILSTISFLEKDRVLGEGISFHEIMEFWSNKKVPSAHNLINDGVEDLKEKGILTTVNDGSTPKYKIGVDLFRRWLSNEKPDIELELGKLYK